MARADTLIFPSHQFNTVMFQAVRSGYAYYPSEILPSSKNYYFDPLDLAVSINRSQNLYSYAWVNLLLVWSSSSFPDHADHIIYQHPQWLFFNPDTVNHDYLDIEGLNQQGVEGIYINPEIPQARDYLKQVIAELISKYQLDGIVIDFVRYPNQMYPRGHSVIMSPPSHHIFTDLTQQSGDLAQQWLNYQYLKDNKHRIEVIDRLISEIKDTVDILDPNVKLVATSFPDIENTSLILGQNWSRWNVDYVCLFVDTSYQDSIPLFPQVNYLLATTSDFYLEDEYHYQGYIYLSDQPDQDVLLNNRQFIWKKYFRPDSSDLNIPELVLINFPTGIRNFNHRLINQLKSFEPEFNRLIDSLSNSRFISEESILYVAIYREDCDQDKIEEAFRFLDEGINPATVTYMFNTDSSPYPSDSTWGLAKLDQLDFPFVLTEQLPQQYLSSDGNTGFYIYQVKFLSQYKYFNEMNPVERSKVIKLFLKNYAEQLSY